MYWTFIAISHVARRTILERLHADNGQSISKLASQTALTRQAIAKHLEVLEHARLVVSKKVGRERLYFIDTPALLTRLEGWVVTFRPPTTRDESAAATPAAAPKRRKKRVYDPERNQDTLGARALRKIKREFRAARGETGPPELPG